MMYKALKYIAIAVWLAMAIAFLASPVWAQGVEIAWDGPTTNEDGSPLTDLAGFKVYIGTAAGGPYETQVVDVGLNTGYTVALPDGRYFIVATAYDASGNESGHSNELEVVLDNTAPGTFTIRIVGK